ncbi:glycoside hydrolase family 15 protein [Vitiosangium sp. GDMCC 1.1324]|uniref:glycoside hydrolase family 15 protein n=1 Tax=Vitiosangium sp. (strain GDMCC 1.1324) TaxID=2138576 RepID=UPI000D36832A|nr:glycoside hydrolase family 15 protein [Vitiosangium sp. GDMCC 1.1324]PTL75789.1 glycoside hydrolase family 15 [Vitiosangium sp. GDMCC 1.1324]
MRAPPISDYALLSDCHSALLVSRRGSVDWLSCPRFDSPSVFGRMLGPAAGHWVLRPVKGRSHRRYLDRTLVLETLHYTPTGIAVQVEAMALGRGKRGHELGAESPGGLVLRRVACVEGQVELETDFCPRPEYGLVHPLLREVEGGVLAQGGADMLRLSSPVRFQFGDCNAFGRFILRAGESVGFALQHRAWWHPPLRAWSQEEIDAWLQDTVEGWRSWSSLHQRYEGPWRELVHHSGRVLQALTFQPTGAIVAAPTTSLPESVGGERNWDYRYTWLRDASLTLEALWVAACPDEASRFFDFLTSAITQLRRGEDLQIMFGIGGEHDLSERMLPHLPGWRGSFPVRVGNGAWQQRQLDVYGELLGAAHRLREYLGGLDEAGREFLMALADTAADRWAEPDQGIWEMRDVPRHHLYSKLMCWVALDRALDMKDLLHPDPERVVRWKRVRRNIRSAILEHGWNARVGAFTQAFDSDVLDASVLMLPIAGFLPASDPRMRATLESISTDLTDDRGLVYRYRASDGLLGEEGTFFLCTFWLAQAYALAGEVERARETFTQAVEYVNDVGLLSEEVEPESGELLGNYPQAFSHIGMVNAAWAITQAEERRRQPASEQAPAPA